MNEIEKINSEFDDKIEINQAVCCFCKVALGESNKSVFRMFFKIDSRPCIGALCVRCKEAFDRLQKSTTVIISKTENEIKAEIKAEGWTDEMLKAKEERDFKTIN
jgi:hypothetical protein